MKGSVEIDTMQPIGFASYCEMCGNTLSRAHARSGHAATISGYLGNSTKFDEAMVSFAAKYGKQTRSRLSGALVSAGGGTAKIRSYDMRPPQACRTRNLIGMSAPDRAAEIRSATSLGGLRSSR